MTDTTSTHERMAALRAMRGSNSITADDLLTVEKLESAAKWHVVRGGGITNTGGDHFVCVDIGDPKAERKVFAFRSGNRSWCVVYGTGSPLQGEYQPGYMVQQFIKADGNVCNVYWLMQTQRNEKRSSRALVGSPFYVHKKHDRGSRDDMGIRAIAGFTLDWSASTRAHGGRQLFLVEGQDAMLGAEPRCSLEMTAELSYVGAEWYFVVDNEDRVVHAAYNDQVLKSLGLYRQSVPARDYQALGFSTTELPAFQQAVLKEFSDEKDQVTAMELALKCMTLAEQLRGIQVEFVYPSHCWTGREWKRAFSVTGSRSHPRYTKSGKAPTEFWSDIMRFPDCPQPPCILLTLPVYKQRGAYYIRERGAQDNHDTTANPPIVRQVLLYPVRNADFQYVNQDCTSVSELGATEQCNFGGKNEIAKRGNVVDLGHATGPHAAVAFCVNGPNSELLNAYWGSKNCGYDGHAKYGTELRTYGWLADIDQIITRVGAMVAEHFFTSAS